MLFFLSSRFVFIRSHTPPLRRESVALTGDGVEEGLSWLSDAMDA